MLIIQSKVLDKEAKYFGFGKRDNLFSMDFPSSTK
ncbi:unnamed protein product [Chironomus riparius]|uniref:Uncharacterized protein n=1 Tax=Chironomus riparius TaxID=315576 RepID=A0A9N9S239_9DIPT|nr:unnamed protein product [Chironomus riparius]